jgi:hypothetical protein
MLEEDCMDYSYLIRYGLMRRVGRFVSEIPGLERGQEVVIRSHRGTELGEVLLDLTATQEAEALPPLADLARVLRVAGPEDLERARRADSERSDRFATCQRIFQDGLWPLELIDVEPLLDLRRTVLHYLGPHHLEAEGLIAAFRTAHDLDVMLEPLGEDVAEMPEPTPDEDHAHGCGHCGSGGGSCGSGGGCSAISGASHGGCADCGIKKWVTARALAAR